MTPEEERRRQELRAKAGLPEGGADLPAPVGQPDMNPTNAPAQIDPRRAELRAKAGLDAAPAQPAVDPSLQNYRVPDQMLGLPMPYAGGETDYVTSSGQGFGLSMPRHAPPAVQGAIAEGVSHGHDRRKKRAGLAARGAVTSRAGGTPGSISHAVGLLTGDPGRQNFETYERAGAVQTGIEDVNTFGLSDEISGMVGGEDALNAQRQMVKDAYHIHPGSTIAGGSTAMIIPGQGIRGASTGARVLSGMGRGTIFGGLYGAGSGEDLADRATKAAGYGAFGGVLGGGFVLGGRGLEYAGRKILGSAELRSVASHLFGRGTNAADIKLVDNAITEMQRAARVEGRKLARDEAKRQLIAAFGRAEMNDMLGDVIPGGVTSMEGSALPGMEGADLVVRRLRERGEGQYERINAAVGKIVEGEDIAGSLANLARIKDEEAQPLYQAAFGADKRIDPNHERFGELNKLLQLPDFQAGRAAGERLLRISRRDPEAQFSQLNPFEQLDWIKKGLDAEIGKLLRAGDNTTAGALIDAKNAMLAIADDMNPTYGQARQVWAGAQAQQDALMLGESLFSTTGQVKTGPAMREIRRQYESYSEAEKTAFSIGLFEKAMDSIGTVIESGTANSAKRGFLSPNSEAALREFLPAEQADEFLSMIQREYRQQMNANQALAGSPTGRRIKAGEAVRMATGGVRAAAAELSDPQGLIRKGQQYLRDTIGNNPTVQRRFAEFLTTDATDSKLQRALGPTPGQGQGTLPPRTVTTPALRATEEAAEVAQSGIPNLVGAPARTAAGGITGGVAGWNNPSDWDGDGEIGFMDRGRSSFAGAAGGATAFNAGPKMLGGLSRRVMGSRNLPEGTQRSTHMGDRFYDIPTQGGGQAQVRFTQGQSGDVTVTMTADLPGVSGGAGTIGQAREVFDGTFRAVQDHAARHRASSYVFSGDTPAKRKFYTNQIRRLGVPEGYVGIVSDDTVTIVRKGGQQHKYAKQYHADDWEIIEKVASSDGRVLQSQADPFVTNGIGGVRRKEVMQGLAGDQFPAAEGSVPRRAPEPQPAGIAGTSDELRGHPLIDDGMAPTGQSDWYDVQVARPMMVEKLVNEGMDPAQARATVDQMGDDVVAALSEQELITARGRYPVGADRDAGVNGQIAGILGAIGIGGGAGYMAMQGSESPNAMSDILASADRATRSGRGLPQTPSLKPSDAMTALLERPDTISEGEALEVTEEDKARGVRAKRVDEDGTVYEFIGGQWRKAR